MANVFKIKSVNNIEAAELYKKSLPLLEKIKEEVVITSSNLNLINIGVDYPELQGVKIDMEENSSNNRSYSVSIEDPRLLRNDIFGVWGMTHATLIFPVEDKNPREVAWSWESFYEDLSYYESSFKAYEEAKKENDKKRAKYKKKLEKYRSQRDEIRAYNKILKEDYKKALREFKKAQKERDKLLKENPSISLEELEPLIEPQEPQYKEEPQKPKEPLLLEVQRPSIGNMELYKTVPWGWFRNFEFFKFKIKNQWFFMAKKRDSILSATIDNLFYGSKIKKLDSEEAISLINREIKALKETNFKRWEYLSTEKLSFLAQEAEDLTFSEKDDSYEEVSLPPLARVKPMHAASMLAGGTNASTKEVELNGEKFLIKSSLLKSRAERETSVNGEIVREVVEFYKPMIGAYNLLRREFTLYE